MLSPSQSESEKVLIFYRIYHLLTVCRPGRVNTTEAGGARTDGTDQTAEEEQTERKLSAVEEIQEEEVIVSSPGVIQKSALSFRSTKKMWEDSTLERRKKEKRSPDLLKDVPDFCPPDPKSQNTSQVGPAGTQV